MTTDDLIEIKKEIEEAKKEKSELEGKKKAYMQQLKEDWNCDTLEEAEGILTEMEANVVKLEHKIEKGLKDFEAKYDLV